MNEFYLGNYQLAQGLAKPLANDQLVKSSDIRRLTEQADVIVSEKEHRLEHFIGNNKSIFVSTSTAKSLLPLAQDALQSGRFTTAMDAQPIYLRDKRGWKTVSQQG